MTPSETKTKVIQSHRANQLLQAPILSPMQRFPKDLAVDQPTMKPDATVVARALAALEEGQTHYVDVPGIPPLREALAAYLKEAGLGSFTPDQVLVTAGIQEARFLTVQMIGALYGQIALPSVVDPGAKKAAGVRRIDVQHLPLGADSGMLPSLQDIRAALEGGCKLIYLESPHRLTGAAYDEAAVAEIARIISDLDGAVIWDQGLSPWVPSYASLAAQTQAEGRVAVLGEAWPGMGLESWLVGYIATNPTWVEPMRSQKQIMSICTSTPSQYGALQVAELYPSIHPKHLDQLAGFRKSAAAATAGTGMHVVPGDAVNVLALKPDSSERMAAGLDRGGYGYANGADFGASGVLRLAVTFDNAIADALGHLS